jgi:hypothetical protein
VQRSTLIRAPSAIVAVMQIVGLVSKTTAGEVFNLPWDACSLGILPTLGKMTSVKYYHDTLGLSVDKPNKFHFDDPWLGFGGLEL